METQLRGWLARHPVSAGACFGGGLGFASNIMLAHWPGMPAAVVTFAFWAGLACILGSLPAIFVWEILPWNYRNIYRTLLVLLFWGICFWSVRHLDHRWGAPPLPDVSMCVLGGKNPAIASLNISDQAAENPRVNATFYNLDSPDPDQPIFLSGQASDVLRASSSVVEKIFGNGDEPQGVSSGNRVIGSIGITCPKCRTGRTFWISMVIGSAGWTAQKDNDASGNSVSVTQWVAPGQKSHWSSSQFLYRIIDAVPEGKRVPIRSIAEPVSVNGAGHLFSLDDCMNRERTSVAR